MNADPDSCPGELLLADPVAIRFRIRTSPLVLCIFYLFKGIVAPGFWGPFWPAWIGLAKKKNLSLFLSFSVTPSNFGGHFKVLKCLIPKNLGDS